MEDDKIIFFIKSFRSLLVYAVIAAIPVGVILVEWSDNLSVNGTPFELLLSMLIFIWVGSTSILGCFGFCMLINILVHRKRVQKMLYTTDLEQVLHTKTLKQLDQILQVLSLQRGRIIRREIKQESTEETRERLIGIILKNQKSDEMKNNASHH